MQRDTFNLEVRRHLSQLDLETKRELRKASRAWVSQLWLWSSLFSFLISKHFVCSLAFKSEPVCFVWSWWIFIIMGTEVWLLLLHFWVMLFDYVEIENRVWSRDFDSSSNVGDNTASQEEDATVATTGVHQANNEVQLESKTKRRIVRSTYLKDFVWSPAIVWGKIWKHWRIRC